MDCLGTFGSQHRDASLVGAAPFGTHEGVALQPSHIVVHAMCLLHPCAARVDARRGLCRVAAQLSLLSNTEKGSNTGRLHARSLEKGETLLKGSKGESERERDRERETGTGGPGRSSESVSLMAHFLYFENLCGGLMP